MRYTRIALIALLAVFMISGGANAANIYKDTYTTEDSSGNWTFAGNVSITGNTTLTGTVNGKESTTILSATANTVGTVTAAKSGSTFILTAPGDSGPYVLTLPTAAAGLTYTFCTATATTLSVKPASTVDTVVYLYLDGKDTRPNASSADKITSPAASGSSVTLIGATGFWYVADMFGTWTDGGV